MLVYAIKRPVKHPVLKVSPSPQFKAAERQDLQEAAPYDSRSNISHLGIGDEVDVVFPPLGTYQWMASFVTENNPRPLTPPVSMNHHFGFPPEDKEC